MVTAQQGKSAIHITGATVVGATHIKKGIPNQDALLIQDLGEAQVLCLSDGHGSKRCFRSHVGAQLAVEALAEAVAALLPELREALKAAAISPEAIPAGGITGVGEPPIAFLRTLAEQTLKRWVQKVMGHLKATPFQTEEVEDLDYAGRRALGGNALLAYGATLMGAVLVDGYLVGVNLGDGDLMVYSKKTVAYYQHSDHNTVADHTYSLCTSGALAYWFYVIRRIDDVDAVLLATDGYRNSYRTLKGFEQVGTDLIKLHAKKGMSVIEADWESWLTETTRLGSGDDITAAIAIMQRKKEKKRLWR